MKIILLFRESMGEFRSMVRKKAKKKKNANRPLGLIFKYLREFFLSFGLNIFRFLLGQL